MSPMTLILLTILIMISLTHSTLTILNPLEIPIPELQVSVDLAQLFTYNHPDPFITINDTLVVYDLEGEVGGYEGRVVWVARDYLYRDVRRIMESGAAVIVFATGRDFPGNLALTVGNIAKKYGWKTPAFQLSLENDGWKELAELIEEQGLLVQVMITDDDNNNLWIEETEMIGWWIVQIVMMVFAFGLAILALEKFIFMMLMREYDRPWYNWKPGETVLIIEFIINTFRGIYLAIDPVNIRQILPVHMSFYALQVTAPIGALTTALLLVHWNNAMTMKGFLTKYRWYIYTFLGVFVILGVAALPILLIIYDPNTTLLYVMASYYVAVSILLSLYIFFTAPGMIKLLKILEFSPKERNRMKTKTVLITITGIFSVLWCLVIGSALLQQAPPIYFTQNFAWIGCLLSISLTQIMVFDSENQYKHFDRKNSRDSKQRALSSIRVDHTAQ